MLRRHAHGLLVAALAAHGQQPRPGIWTGPGIDSFPLPASGFEVYLAGELHGIQENAAFQLAWLDRLRAASSLRDIAIEEDAVYEEEAQAYIEGRAPTLPPPLCLRADLLDGLRARNRTLPPNQRLRVHLIDVDSPADAIALHLRRLAARLRAASLPLPAAAHIRRRGLDAVAALRKLARQDSPESSELRTIEHSIHCLQQGFEVSLGPNKGSPYLNPREEAIASNITDLIRSGRAAPLLVAYGADHVTRRPRRDGGPNRDQPFAPMALRLQTAGLRAFSLAAFPLAGSSRWRGRLYEFPWTAGEGKLSTGETLASLLNSGNGHHMIYLDRATVRATLPTQDMNQMETDAILLFRAGTPQADRCSAP